MSLNYNQDIETKELLNELVNKRILVTDGAMGTALEALKPTPADFGGEQFLGCNEMLNAGAPHLVKAVHRAYLDAGADIIETNSFNGSPIVLAEYGIANRCRELAQRSAELAKEAVKEWEEEQPPPTPPFNRRGGNEAAFSRRGGDEAALNRRGEEGRRFIMGSMGPGTKSLSVTGGATFDEIREAYRIYASGLLEGGADLLVLETQQDTLNLKAALHGIRQAQSELGRDAPLALSVTIELSGMMLAGQNIEALYHTVANFDLFSIGLNCATGPARMSDHLRTLARLSRFPVSVWPNAGLPDPDGNYSEGPDLFREVIGRFAREGFINIAGGCCGTTPEHIRAIKQAVADVTPRTPVSGGRFPALAGAEAMVVEESNRPVYVGERTNTIGSRKFKRLVKDEKWDEASEIGREQVRKGAMVLDVCAADPDREEISDLLHILHPLLRKVRVPILIDTTDVAAVEAALKVVGGKPAINSVNLEDGGERLRIVAGLAKTYGASLICGLIDDDPQSGMAVTIRRKFEIADKIYRILKDEFDIPDCDIIFDPLVFPAGTGDANYIGSAKATIDGTRAIKQRYPDCLTILGISNVSFGLPPAGREVVNSVFLFQCAKAGLDMAIVNTQGLRRYPTIPAEEVKLAEDVLVKGDSESITTFTRHFREAQVTASEDEWAGMSAEEQVSRAVVEARRAGLEKNLTELLSRMTPLAVINGPLLSGMDEVGRLFADNRLIVAEVLESAEVMKVAVDFIRPYFPPGETGGVKGKMLLATVKGDVHDIGKNLVDMIMSNNGFDIVNLGIKVPPETLIQAVKDHDPDMIGLSGLLVRSAQQMVATAEDLTAAGIDIPLIVGGAALSKKFTLTRIAPAYKGPVFYAAEAMEGLALGNQIVQPEAMQALVEKWTKLRREAEAPAGGKFDQKMEAASEAERGAKWIPTGVPAPPDFEEHIIGLVPLEEVWKYLNLQMLYGKHLGVRNVKKRLNDPADEKIVKLKAQVQAVAEEAVRHGVIAPRGIYRWFRVRPEGERIRILTKDNTETSNQVIKYQVIKNDNRNSIPSSLIPHPSSLIPSRSLIPHPLDNPPLPPPSIERGEVETNPSIEGGEVETNPSIEGGEVVFSFPRQRGRQGISAVDWVRPPDQGGDAVALFVTTSGADTGALAAKWREEGRLLDSLILQSVAIELAEAAAEWLHRRIRAEWGISDHPELLVADLFRANYRGIRLSFGYPACPQLEDQAPLFNLLKPERIGVSLTEGFMMHPEGSVSAVVFHHPEGKYYAI